MRSRPVSIDLDGLAGRVRAPGDAVRLDLFIDASFDAVLDRVETLSPGRQVLSGHVRGQKDSSFTFVIRDGVMLGNIRIPSLDAYFQVRYLGDGVHVVRQIDERQFPPCGVGPEEALGALEAPVGQVAGVGECVDDGSVIDLLVVYTTVAREAEGGTAAIEALIDLSITASNTSYGNSQINTRLRLVHSAEVSYDESSGMSLALSRLRQPADGYLDQIHDLRDQHGADMVALLVDSGSYCGIAYVMQTLSADFATKAFSVTKRTCAAGNLTFAHELGHNMGCAHDRENAGVPGLFSYSYGYQDPNNEFRTVMAYSCPGGCPRVQHFSNPDVTYNGLVTGVPVGGANEAHNALTINQSAQTIACFRNADCNNNGIPDYQDIANGTSQDCSGNGVPDECEPDCNQNGEADSCDILDGISEDCEGNGVPDECEPYSDCNENGTHDPCDIRDGISNDCNGNWIPDECLTIEGDCNQNLIPDSCDIADGTSRDCNQNGKPDECDLADGTSGDCNTNGIPDECDVVEGISGDCNTNDRLDVCEIVDGTLPDIDGNGVPDACETAILFVDAGATGLNYGTSWENAYTDLQDALGIAAEPTNPLTQIWVADGIYIPSKRTEPDDPRSATFQLGRGVAVYGGFAGGEDSLENRDPTGNVAVLSGDLNGDDGPDFANYQDNTYHVVTGSDADRSSILDGFTITGGNADGGYYPYRHNAGAGVLNDRGSPTVSNCVIEWNFAITSGGGMYNYSHSDPLVIGCTFRNNARVGMSNVRSSPMVTGCTFVDNFAASSGGAIYSYLGTPRITNCAFYGNTAASGGAVCNNGSSPVISNCIFTGNTAYLYGGAIFNQAGASMTLTNSTFSKNEARKGGGMFIGTSSATINNCVLWGNSDDDSQLIEEAQIAVGNEGTFTVDYSCIHGWTGDFGGRGNIGDDPLLLDADGRDGMPGTVDDNLRLSPGSPGIDAGDNLVVPVDIVDLDRDGDTVERLPIDLDGYPRFIDIASSPHAGSGVPPIVDMGAYEHHTDCNGNGVPDRQDLAAQTSTDCNDNGILDECEAGASRFSGFALVAIAATGTYSYTPVCNEITMSAGETVTLEIRLAGWDPDTNGDPRLLAYSAQLDSSGLTSGASGALTPAVIPCFTDDDCSWTARCETTGFCEQKAAAYIDISRTDFVFSPVAAIAAVDINQPDFRFAGIVLSASASVIDPGMPKYAGTLILDVSPDAGGTFDVGFFPGGDTFLLDRYSNHLPTPGLTPVRITIPIDCNNNGVEDSVDLARGTSRDCNENGIPDECDVADGTSEDCDGNIEPDECQLDCDLDQIPDACELPPLGNSSDCNRNDVPDECDVADGTSEDCNTNIIPDNCETDCNLSGAPDDCDILAGTSTDLDGNGVPDECDAMPDADAAGCRYLAITPPPGTEPVALYVTAPSYPCLTRYITPDGHLSLTRSYLLPDAWGTVYVSDPDLVPDVQYYIQTEIGGQWSAPARVVTARWGDVTGWYIDGQWEPPNGGVNILDATAALARFVNLPDAPPLPACDLQPERPDGVVDIQDIMYIIDAFRGFPYPFDDPAPCP
jgi:hypothetical protein